MNLYNSLLAAKLAGGITADKLAADENIILYNLQSGVKNILQNNAKTVTNAGITFTVNADKSITMSASGEATNYYAYPITGGRTYAEAMPLPRGIYVLSGVAPNADQHSSFYQIGTFSDSAASLSWATTTSKEYEITVDNDTTRIVLEIYVPRGSTGVNGVTYYPMIERKDIRATDSSYSAPAWSNAELTAAIQALQAQLAE